MKPFPAGRVARAFVLAALVSLPVVALDRNGNGLDDLWESAHGPAALVPLADADGDGATNAAESAAGTNPHDGRSRFAVSETTQLAANVFRLRWPTVAGKRYRVQATGDLATWHDVGAPALGDGTSYELTLDTATAFTGGGANVSRWINRVDVSLSLLKAWASAGTPAADQTSRVATLDVSQTDPDEDMFGQWIRGWIVAPVTGDYTFWISSDDQSELWLSTDRTVANKRRIARLTSWAYPGEWNRAASQQSALIHLEANRAYYFEVFHNDWGSSEHVTVAWSGAPVGSATPVVIGGANLSATGVPLAELGTGALYFRVVVDDVDSDGDGLTDYDERLIGFDPNNPTTTPRVADLATVTRLLDTPSTVTVGSADSRAYESDGHAAEISFFRSGGLAPLEIHYTVGGTATSGADFAPVAGVVKLPIGVNSVTVPIAPLTDALAEPAESVVVSLSSNPGYLTGAPAAVTATIDDARDILYVAQLRPPTGTRSAGSGAAAVRTAGNLFWSKVGVSYGTLTSPELDSELYVSDTGEAGVVVLALPQGQIGTRDWTVAAAGGLAPADIHAALAAGRVWVRVRSANLPGGELRGRLVVAPGWDTMPAPPAPPVAPATAANDAEAARFLIQASFGPDAASIAQVRSLGFAGWVDAQLALPPTYHLPYFNTRAAELYARDGNEGWSTPRQEAWWQHALTAPDQLRQRMALALSEILVVSQRGALEGEHRGVTIYYDLLLQHAFGNYRDLLGDVTRSPMMGVYLSMMRNRKPDPVTGHEPDENYAREIMQLFSIGLSQLHPDGSLKLNGEGMPVPTYSQDDIVGLAHVFTGWGPHFDPANPPLRDWDGLPWDPTDWFIWGFDGLKPMTFHTGFGDFQDRTIVNGTVVAGSLTGAQRLDLALDTLFQHPNVGPFLARRLIQRFVTSNPSPAYIHRVASVFNNNGTGVRGDLGATLKAVLLDPEARRSESLLDYAYGKHIEPLLRLTRLFRAFPPGPGPFAGAGDPRLFINLEWEMEEQSPLLSPSVFNFFQPGFAQPGAIAAAGLVSPEFQILSDTTIMAQSNRNFGSIHWGLWIGEPAGTGSSLDLDFSAGVTVLTNPGRTHVQAQGDLADFLNTRLLGGTMSPFLRAKLLETWASLPGWFGYGADAQRQRVQIGVYLVVFSPEFTVQR